MRVIPILLLLVAIVASAGCFGKDDEPPATTPTNTTGGTGPTPTTPMGTTPTNPTAPTTPTMPTPVTPRELCAATEDYSDNVNPGPPPAPAPATVECGTVPAGYTKVTLNGTFTSSEPLTVANAISAKLIDAAGMALITCAGPGPGQTTTTACTGEAVVVAGGVYSMFYEGEGNVDFAGSVTIS